MRPTSACRTGPSFGLAALLTTLVALGPLSTDLYLPALPTLVEVFRTDAARVQLSLSIFLVGFAVAQLAYGALSDRFGRRPVMLGGLALYFVASIGCAFASSIEMLIGARFLQALGACAGPVLGRAIVRDVWGPVEAVRVLAYVSGSMALAPLLGPTLGGFLTVWFGWQANFALLALFSGLQVLAVWRWLGESNAHPDPAATRPGRMFGNFRILLLDRNYVGYLLAMSFSFSALFAFISGSSFILIGRFGLRPEVFGMCFGLVVAGYLSGSMLSGSLVRRFGGDRLLMIGAWLGALAWRLGRYRPALWKGLVLSAGGSTLCWLLLTTLWLPALNYGLGQAPISRRIAALTPAGSCVLVHGLNASQITGLQYHGQLELERARRDRRSDCRLLVVEPNAVDTLTQTVDLSQWRALRKVPRLRENRDGLLVYLRR